MSSSVLSFFYGPVFTLHMTNEKIIALTDYMDLCLCFLISCLDFCPSFPSKEEASLNIMAAVTIYSDFGAQENKV